MSEEQAIYQLIVMAGTLMCLPYILFRLIPTLVKLAHVHFFPPTHIDVKIVDGDKVYTKTISLKDRKDIVNSILNNKAGD